VKTDLELIQEIFDSEPAIAALGAPIGLQATADAMRDLRRLAGGQGRQ